MVRFFLFNFFLLGFLLPCTVSLNMTLYMIVIETIDQEVISLSVTKIWNEFVNQMAQWQCSWYGVGDRGFEIESHNWKNVCVYTAIDLI